MKIKLKNIGTLKQAEIDLSKDLIVLAGPNNTGKTYAAYTVYGVCEKLKNITFDMGDNDVSNAWGTLLMEYILKGQEHESSINITDFLKNYIDSVNNTFDKNKCSDFLGSIFANDGSSFTNSELAIIFDLDTLTKYLIGIESVHFLSRYKNRIELTKHKGEDVFNYRFHLNESEDKSVSVVKFITSIYESIILWTTEAYFKNIYINTAERSAINIFSKELSIKRNAIVDQLLELRESKNGNANQLLDKLQRYSLPIRDSLEIAEDLANISRNKSDYTFLADRMEEVLLDGKINISKYGEVQYSPDKSKVKNLSMNLSGSIVKSLSSLVIYFRHLAKKGDFIIIDEPELNLHPDNQRKITRLIGEFVNHGFKVMISTHSDYIIREINNLVMLKSGAEKANDLIKKYGYEEKQLIDHQRVGAYLFKNNRNYDIEVTETGFEVDTIDEEINNLNTASEEIYFTLFD